MEQAKSNVLKSKSSKSAVATRTEKPSNKKSMSNGEVHLKMLKKRGVYVEKKITNTKIAEPGRPEKPTSSTGTTRPPRRPRPNRKKLINSVLTVLSKNTAGTQYPSLSQEDIKRNKTQKSHITLKNESKYTEGQVTEEIKVQGKNVCKQNTLRYRSKALRTNLPEASPVVVLQSKRNIIQTPSNYSEKSSKDNFDESSSKWLEIKHKDARESVKDLLGKSIYGDIAGRIAAAVIEGKDYKKNKLKTLDNDQPLTLLRSVDSQQDPGLYKIFLDILQTTISVYNVGTNNKADTKSSSESVSSLKMLAIDESVVTKLNVAEVKSENCVCDVDINIDKNDCNNFSIGNDDINVCNLSTQFVNMQQMPSRPISQIKENRTPMKRKLETKSLLYPKETWLHQKPFQIANVKPKTRRNRKQTLLSIIKQELSVPSYTYDPKNLYAALQDIARKKERSKKMFHFEESIVGPPDGGDDSRCTLKRRKVLTASKKSKRRNNTENKDFRILGPSVSQKVLATSFNQIRNEYANDIDELGSNHSLEVYAVEHDDKDKKAKLKYGRSLSGSDGDDE